MVVKVYAKEIAAAVVLVAVAAVTFMHYSESGKRRDFEAKRQQVLSDLAKIESTYHTRGKLIREWTKTLPVKDREEIRVLLSENDGLRLQEGVEMQRFDFVQERLNFLIGKWTEDKKLGKLKPKEFVEVERTMLAQRKAYAEAAFRLNAQACKQCRGMELPVFPAELMVLSSR